MIESKVEIVAVSTCGARSRESRIVVEKESASGFNSRNASHILQWSSDSGQRCKTGVRSHAGCRDGITNIAVMSVEYGVDVGHVGGVERVCTR